MLPLIPMLLLSSFWDGFDQPRSFSDHNFGLGLRGNQLYLPRVLDRFYNYPTRALRLGPLSNLVPTDLDIGTSTINKDKYQVGLDVQEFKPEEINVKVAGRYVTVEAKHKEKKDEHGWISRQFVRKYYLPEEVDIDQVASTISTDGILTITAPLKKDLKQDERTIKIEITGKPAIAERTTEERKPEIQETTTAGTEQDVEEINVEEEP